VLNVSALPAADRRISSITILWPPTEAKPAYEFIRTLLSPAVGFDDRLQEMDSTFTVAAESGEGHSPGYHRLNWLFKITIGTTQDRLSRPSARRIFDSCSDWRSKHRVVQARRLGCIYDRQAPEVYGRAELSLQVGTSTNLVPGFALNASSSSSSTQRVFPRTFQTLEAKHHDWQFLKPETGGAFKIVTVSLPAQTLHLVGGRQPHLQHHRLKHRSRWRGRFEFTISPSMLEIIAEAFCFRRIVGQRERSRGAADLGSSVVRPGSPDLSGSARLPAPVTPGPVDHNRRPPASRSRSICRSRSTPTVRR